MQHKWLERTELLIKENGIKNLQKSHILVVGLGGVGSFATEFLVRAGIGKLTIVDGDTIDITNINRQLPADHTTIGKFKTEVVAKHLLVINPNLDLKVIPNFLSPQEAYDIVDKKYDYILDCIDSVQPKVQLLIACKRKKVKVVSAMGAGGKMDPTKIKVRDISKTQDCTLARVIKKELKKHKIHKGIRCVFSTEIQDKSSVFITDGTNFKRSFYGTISYMPAIFGLYASAEVINKLITVK
jgi:tRNA A37 threonylcarbamoyladenosine dehydratase